MFLIRYVSHTTLSINWQTEIGGRNKPSRSVLLFSVTLKHRRCWLVFLQLAKSILRCREMTVSRARRYTLRTLLRNRFRAHPGFSLHFAAYDDYYSRLN